MKANVDSSIKNKRNQLWKVDACTWPVVNFFLASVVPRSARNWSRPPPSAISLSLLTLSLLQPPSPPPSPSPPPPSTLFHFFTPLYVNVVLLFLSIFPQRSLKQQDGDVTVHFHRAPTNQPSTATTVWKELYLSGDTWAVLSAQISLKYLQLKLSKFEFKDRPESPPTHDKSKVEQGHQKSLQGLDFCSGVLPCTPPQVGQDSSTSSLAVRVEAGARAEPHWLARRKAPVSCRLGQ